MRERTGSTPPSGLPFWKEKSLKAMTRSEWESICDGCGICCLHKAEDVHTGKIFLTAVACKYLDLRTVRCTVYNDPFVEASLCRRLTPDTIQEMTWLPETCAYRRLWEGKNLPRWHPLVTGSRESVHRAGISVRNRAVSERYVHPEDMTRLLLREIPEDAP